MKKQTKRFVSALLICCMMILGLGMVCQATGGTSDATLASLEISPGTLTPEFSPDVYEYSVEVDADCDRILVNGETTDSGAKMVIAGNSGLRQGTNTVIINVTAADGVTTARYTLNVVRGAGSSSTESTAAEGTGQNGESQDAGTASAGTVVTASKTITLSEPDASAVPEGFTESSITVSGQTVKAWRFPSAYDIEGFYLIYGTDEAGQTAFYIYDERNASVILAPEGVLSMGQESLISQTQLTDSQENYQSQLRTRMLVIMILAVLCFVLLIALTAVATRRKHGQETRGGKEIRSGRNRGYDRAADGKSVYRDSEEDDDQPLYEEDEEDGYEDSGSYEDDGDDPFYEAEPDDGPDRYEGGVTEELPLPSEKADYMPEDDEDLDMFDLDEEETVPEEAIPEEVPENPVFGTDGAPETETYGVSDLEELDLDLDLDLDDEPVTDHGAAGVPEDDFEFTVPSLEEMSEESRPEENGEDEDDDLDADFDLLEALLSDSVRTEKPEGADSIVNRAARKAGRSRTEEASGTAKPARRILKADGPEQTEPEKPDHDDEDDDLEFLDL